MRAETVAGIVLLASSVVLFAYYFVSGLLAEDSAPGPSREGLLTGAAGTAGAPGTPPAVPSDPRVGRAVPPAPVRRVHHP